MSFVTLRYLFIFNLQIFAKSILFPYLAWGNKISQTNSEMGRFRKAKRVGSYFEF